MPRAEEPDAPRTDPNPGAAPSANAERTPSAAGTVSTERPITSASSDTLLSVPQATRADLALDERVAALEREVRDLNQRLSALSEREPERRGSSVQFRWFWLVFLAGLALAWQILAHLR